MVNVNSHSNIVHCRLYCDQIIYATMIMRFGIYSIMVTHCSTVRNYTPQSWQMSSLKNLVLDPVICNIKPGRGRIMD